MMAIQEKLKQIQSQLVVNKSQYNSFGKYYYRSLEDIAAAVKPLCAETGTVLTLNDEVILVGDRYYICATATLTDTETSSKIEVNAYAREEQTKKGMDAAQITGSASSYARKYALNGLFCLDDVKDPDGQSAEDKPTNGKSAENGKEMFGGKIMATDAERLKLAEVAKDCEYQPEEMKSLIKSRYRVAGSAQMTGEQITDLIAHLEEQAAIAEEVS